MSNWFYDTFQDYRPPGYGTAGKSGVAVEGYLPTPQVAEYEKVWDALQIIGNNERQADVVAANETEKTASGLKFTSLILIAGLIAAGGWWWWKKRKRK